MIRQASRQLAAALLVVVVVVVVPASMAAEAQEGHGLRAGGHGPLHPAGHHQQIIKGPGHQSHNHHHHHHHHSSPRTQARKLLSAAGLTATHAASSVDAAQIWPPRPPYGPNCTPLLRGGGGGPCNQPAGWGGNPYYTPDGYVRPMPLAQPAALGGR